MDVLLIGGLWLDASAWRDVLPELEARGHRPVAVALPGQGDGRTDATLADQLDAVLAAVDAAAEPPLVVGHSAACTLAWLAADRRPARVAGVVLIGGMPTPEGQPYADFFPLVDGAMPFPGWAPFEGPDSDDLTDAQKDEIAASGIAVPGGVTQALVKYLDERRRAVPTVMICPEYSPEDARDWIESGQVPELAEATNLRLVDLESGHWPMFTSPAGLARLIADATTTTDAVGARPTASESAG